MERSGDCTSLAGERPSPDGVEAGVSKRHPGPHIIVRKPVPGAATLATLVDPRPPPVSEARVPAPQPHNAIVAVTLNCNARCTMCDIWQNDMHGEAGPEVFARLPAS